MRFARILFAMALAVMAGPAFAQSSIINSGAVAPGHVPMYVQGGVGSQVVATDSGAAAGGNVGLGLSELLAVARGTGTAPYAAQGTGPLGTNICDYDAPVTNATGYHYLCFSANAQGGALIATGAGGSASAQPLCFIVNGAPVCIGGSSGTNVATFTPPTTVGVFPCWASTSGLLANCSLNAATLVGNPAGSTAKANAFTLSSLPARGAPDANNDKILILNNSTGLFNYVTPGLIASAATAGVSSLGGVTGAITLGGNLSMVGSVLTGGAGGSSGQILWNNGGAQAGFTATGDVSITPSTGATAITANAVTNAKINPGAANTMKGSLNGSSTSDITLVACSAIYQFTQWVSGTGWQCGTTPVLPSRAVAASLNLSAFTAVTSQGYAGGGDGGGSVFKNVGSSAFTDTYITGASVTSGGSGYTNGTYKSVGFGGGTGIGCNGIVVVSGGAVTAFNLTGTLCPGYSVGDVLIPGVPGGGSGATVTVTAESAPLGSFIDAAGHHYQYVVDSGGFPNVRQFGAKLDWDGNDGTATNDLLSFKSAIAFAMFPKDSAAALVTGTTIIVPKGTALLCDGTAPFSTLIVPGGVTIRGGSTYSASNLKQCSSENAATNFITLCDPNSIGGVFGCRLIDIGVLADGATNSGVAAVYSNSGQQFPLLQNVYIQPGTRMCLKYETGSGGASNAIFDTVDCERSSTTSNNGVSFNSSNTIGVFRNWVWGCAPAKCASGVYAFTTATGASGNAVIENFHIEGHADDINIANTDQVTIRNGTIGSGTGCNGITLQGTSVTGHTLIENIQSTCNPTVLNGHAGGTNIPGSIVLQVAP